jgi:hypothetical protein
MGESAAVLYYGLPLREAGSTRRGQEHTLSLTGLAPGSPVSGLVLTAPGAGLIGSPFTTARPPAANGTPQIVPEIIARL